MARFLHCTLQSFENCQQCSQNASISVYDIKMNYGPVYVPKLKNYKIIADNDVSWLGAITNYSNLQGNMEEVCGWVSNPLYLCHILFTQVMMLIMILQCSSSITHLDVCIHLSFPGESLSIMYSILLLVCFSLFLG